MGPLEELDQRIAKYEAKVGVVGLGYVGLPLLIEFSKAGFSAVGFDIDPEKVRMLNEGHSYIGDVPSEEVERVRTSGRVKITTEFEALSEIDIINVCVPTPLTKTRDPDVSHILEAVSEIQKRLRSGRLIILGSTTYPGTTHDLFVPILEESGLQVGKDISVAFAPERIDPANKEFSVRNVPKVVGGETPVCTGLAVKVFEKIFDEVVPVSSSQSAEMVKLLENTFRAINIGLANEVALMCDKLGLDVWEVIDAAETKPYGFMKFHPGPGLGGHCVPIDPAYLAWKMKSLNFPARFIELATDINGHMPQHVMNVATELLNDERLSVKGSRILLLGLAYKADVADIRESPALELIRLFCEKGAVLSYHDPYVPEITVGDFDAKSTDLTDDALEEADLVVIVTDHSSVDYRRVVSKAARIFDTRNATRDVIEGRDKVRRL